MVEFQDSPVRETDRLGPGATPPTISHLVLLKPNHVGLLWGELQVRG
jgi:hypothetical protein